MREPSPGGCPYSWSRIAKFLNVGLAHGINCLGKPRKWRMAWPEVWTASPPVYTR